MTTTNTRRNWNSRSNDETTELKPDGRRKPAVNRTALLELLETYRPIDAGEAACRDRFVAFVQAQPRCFERALAVGHVTGSAWIVDRSGARVLLTHHRKLDIWVQPGGHADGDPDIAAVAARESREETGLDGLAGDASAVFDLDIHPIPARGDVPAHEHFDVRFAFRATQSEAFIVSDESHALAWVALDELERFTREPSMLRMREKWLIRRVPFRS
jgi:8-oxo-dGTP pyrophosphatase MutT (NUDIX family)